MTLSGDYVMLNITAGNVNRKLQKMLERISDMDNRTNYNENNTQYTEYQSGSNYDYQPQGTFNGNAYETSSYYESAVDRADIKAKIISRSFIVMFLSLLITAFAATMVAMNPEWFYQVAQSFGIFLVIELVVVIGASFAVSKRKAILAGILYTIYTIINGMTLSIIFYVYELGSVQEIFLMTAVLFGVMAVLGMTTKIDLSKVGGICTMLLIGALIVTAVNFIFLHSTGLDLLLDYLVVAIFVGLTAWDTQKMKRMAETAGNSEVNVIAIYCGMELYLDFINLFLRLLAIFGKKRN